MGVYCVHGYSPPEHYFGLSTADDEICGLTDAVYKEPHSDSGSQLVLVKGTVSLCGVLRFVFLLPPIVQRKSLIDGVNDSVNSHLSLC